MRKLVSKGEKQKQKHKTMVTELEIDPSESWEMNLGIQALGHHAVLPVKWNHALPEIQW